MRPWAACWPWVRQVRLTLRPQTSRVASAADHELAGAVPARWLERHVRPPRRGPCRPALRPARGRGESQRRWRHSGWDDRGAGAARWLHASGGQQRAVLCHASSMPESGFDLLRDFAPVSNIAKVPVGLVVNSGQARRQGSRGLSRRGAQGAGLDQHRLVGPRHDAASRHRAVAAAHRHQADARALSRRRSRAAGPSSGPARRHVPAAEHRGVLRPVAAACARSPSRPRSARA